MQLRPTYADYDIMNSGDQMSVYAELERKGFLNSDLVNASNSGVDVYKRQPPDRCWETDGVRNPPGFVSPGVCKSCNDPSDFRLYNRYPSIYSEKKRSKN